MKNKITLKFREIDRNIFDAIKGGIKRVETRAATKKYHHITAGDLIICSCGKSKFSKKVARSEVFNSIAALLKIYKLRDINPFCHTRTELGAMYKSFPGYKEKIKKFGLIALELK